MTTASDIATSALQRLLVTPIGGEPEGEDMTTALRELNFMINGWKAEGVDLELGTLDAGDTLTSDTKYDEAISLVLGQRLAPFYLKQALFAREADRAWKVLSADFHTAPTATFDPIMTRMPSQVNNA